MKHHSLGHVDGDKVIITAQGARKLVLGNLGWLRLQAQDSLDILLSLGNRQVTPVVDIVSQTCSHKLS